MMLKGTSGISSSVSLSYEPEAEALFTRMAALGEEPSTDRKAAINNFIWQEKICGNWAKYDGLYFTAAHGPESARLNWITGGINDIPNLDQFSFVIDRGITGSTGLATNICNTSTFSKYTLNNASVGVYSRTNSTAGTRMLAISDGNIRMQFGLRNTADQVPIIRMNDATNDTTTGGFQTDSRGLTVINRVISSAKNIYKNGSLMESISRASASIAGNFRIDADTTYELSFIFVSAGSIAHLAQYKNVQQYLTALGAAV